MPMYTRNAAFVVAGYDVTNKESLDVCIWRIEDLKKRMGIGERCLIVAVGNKIDLPRKVSREEAISSFEKCGIPASHYFETSAKTGEGVNKFLEGTLRLWYEANKDHLNDFKSEPTSQTHDDKKKRDCIIC